MAKAAHPHLDSLNAFDLVLWQTKLSGSATTEKHMSLLYGDVGIDIEADFGGKVMLDLHPVSKYFKRQPNISLIHLIISCSNDKKEKKPSSSTPAPKKRKLEGHGSAEKAKNAKPLYTTLTEAQKMALYAAFFANHPDEGEKAQRRSLFQDLKIAKCTDFFEQHFGKYPVIFISFKDMFDSSWASMSRGIINRIAELFTHHLYIRDALQDISRARFDKYVNQTMDRDEDYVDCLLDLGKYLFEYWQQQAILLVDEYDWPMENARGFSSDAFGFMKSMYSRACKTNGPIFRTLFVGVLPLGRDTFLSGLNNVTHYPLYSCTAIAPRKDAFCDFGAFTKAEVELLLAAMDLQESLALISAKYGGYLAGNGAQLYNPYSVANFLSKGTALNFWKNTSQDRTLQSYLKKTSLSFRKNIQDMFLQQNGDPVLPEGRTVKIAPTLHYEDVMNVTLWDAAHEESLYTLLYHNGYLGVTATSDGTIAKLYVPNDEVFEQWREWIPQMTQRSQSTSFRNCFESLFVGDVERFATEFPNLFVEVISIHDINDSRRTNLYEAYYHQFVLGAIAMFHGHDYKVYSNPETGLGRADVRIVPQHLEKSTAIIFEFKRLDSKVHKRDLTAALKKSAKEGLQQIFANDYRIGLPDFVGSLVEVGISFYDKSAFVAARLLDKCDDGSWNLQKEANTPSIAETYEEVATHSTEAASTSPGSLTPRDRGISKKRRREERQECGPSESETAKMRKLTSVWKPSRPFIGPPAPVKAGKTIAVNKQMPKERGEGLCFGDLKDVSTIPYAQTNLDLKATVLQEPLVLDAARYRELTSAQVLGCMLGERHAFGFFGLDRFMVDKSQFIAEAMLSTGRASVIIRPRGFGRSVNAKLLEVFLRKPERPEPENIKYFKQLKIFKWPEFVRAHFAAHPVIVIELLDVPYGSWQIHRRYIRRSIERSCTQHDYLGHSDDKVTREAYKALCHDLQDGTTDRIAMYVTRLAECLKRYHGSPCIIIVDDYDCPLQRSLRGGYFQQAKQFFTRLYRGLAKDTNVLKTFFVGNQAIGYTDVLEGINGIDRYILSTSGNDTSVNNPFTTCFGYTKAEVGLLLEGVEPSDHHQKGLERGHKYPLGQNDTLMSPYFVGHLLSKAVIPSFQPDDPWWPKEI
ncbi:hypothetical protein BZG36_05317 [Bifiguratus adelaidae]|uniref:AAA-ATPase-like domain-containing protein n=1 Tax=Bifiguratus adelaidae TaxID=1938954 RepID=A0A261XV25_9FUNG|nr:hypothetical protein BZG36_05317 [Bifiguratus adelaidae]